MDTLLYFSPLLARLLIGFYFVFFGLWNIYHWRPIILVMTEKNIQHPWLVLPIGIAWETVLGGMVMFGIYTKLAALALIPFTLVAICLFHPYWRFKGHERNLNLAIFIANLTTTIPALLLLLSNISSSTSLIN